MERNFAAKIEDCFSSGALLELIAPAAWAGCTAFLWLWLDAPFIAALAFGFILAFPAGAALMACAMLLGLVSMPFAERSYAPGELDRELRALDRAEKERRKEARRAAAQQGSDPLPLIGAALFGGWLASRHGD